MTTEAAPKEVQFVDPTVITRRAKTEDFGSITISSPDAIFVIGGEYRDEPDLVVEIVHAVNPDGYDISEDVARRIADLLAGA